LTPRLDDPADETIADLFHQLVDDGSNVVRAEVNLYKQIALRRAARARAGLIALVIGLVLLLDALLVLLVMLAIGLAVHFGPVAAGLIVALVVGGAGFLLVRYGAVGVAALGGDEEEKAALQSGATRP
jgi:hypothetical protein